MLILQKNILILPLALFIQFNKKKAGERLGNLLGHSLDDLFAGAKELHDHEKICQKQLNNLLQSQIVADFNLGKKNKQEFISEALSFFKLSNDKTLDFESAWDSLIEFDVELHDVFEELMKLIEQGLSIYFIGDTNALHAQKVLDLFKQNGYKKLSLVENLTEPVGAFPLAITATSEASANANLTTSSIGSVYLCLSYFYQSLVEQSSCILTKLFTLQSTSGLLTQLITYLTSQNKTKEDILLVNLHRKASSISKKLALDTMSKDNFFKELRYSASGSMLSLSLIDSLSSIESSCDSVEQLPMATYGV